MSSSAGKTPHASVPIPGVRRVIAMGASAGGLHPLLEVLAVLPESLPAVIIVATHMGKTSMMPELIARVCPMRVVRAAPTSIEISTVYVACPGNHLVVHDGDLKLLNTAPVRFLRPNIDLLFESVAKSFRQRSVGVVLSGTGYDGAKGLLAIKNAGGVTMVEDPQSAEFPEMPRAALLTDSIDLVLSSDKIGEALIKLCAEPT